MAREGISSDSKSKQITEIPGTPVPGPHQFARILDMFLKVDRYIDKLEKASLQVWVS